jgi:hypothetical protein
VRSMLRCPDWPFGNSAASRPQEPLGLLALAGAGPALMGLHGLPEDREW